MDLRRGLNRVGLLAGAIVAVPSAIAVLIAIGGAQGSKNPSAVEDIFFFGSLFIAPLVVFSLVFLTVWFFFFALGWVIAGFQPTTAGEHNSESKDVHGV